MKPIYEVVREVLDDLELSYEELREKNVIRFGLAGQHARWDCFAEAREEIQVYSLLALAPLTIPEEKRPAVAELVCRINYAMQIGGYRHDLGDGEVNYTNTVDLEGTLDPKPVIRQATMAVLSTCDHFFPAFASIVYADLSPLQALEKLQGEG